MRKKENNQYYGKAFEIYLASFLSGENHYTEKQEQIFQKIGVDQQEVKNDAFLCSKNFKNVSNVKWVGDRTNNENCDIIIDNYRYEIKYVSHGKGTYFNTSVFYLLDYGFDYREYLKKYGIYEKLREIPNISVKENNKSPVSIETSSIIRKTKEYENIYKQVKDKEKKCRLVFVSDLYNYFLNNPESFYIFISDMLNKNTTKNKNGAPDSIVVFNYKSKNIALFNIKDFAINDDSIIELKEASLLYRGIRICFSWQNGVGLNNPTIRIFI